MVTPKSMARFLRLAGRLKNEKRRGWIEKVGIKLPESVADHTFRTVMISMLIGDLKGLDTCKMMRIALIHDLAECIIGDTISVDSKSIESKRAKEDQAMKKILKYLPESIGRMYHVLWADWLGSRSVESKMVHDIDKLEMILQAFEYSDEGYPQKKLNGFWQSAVKQISDKDLLALVLSSQSSL